MVEASHPAGPSAEITTFGSWLHGEKDRLTVSDYDRMLVMRRQTSICGTDCPAVTQQALVARADCDNGLDCDDYLSLSFVRQRFSK